MYKGIVILSAVISLEELNRKNIIKPGVLIREGDTVGLATNTLEYSKRTNLTRGKLSVLKFKVLGGELDKVSHFKLLKDVINIIITGYTFLCLNQAATQPLSQLVKLFDTVSNSGYPPLNDDIRDINTDFVVESKQ